MTTAQRHLKLAYWRRVLAWNEKQSVTVKRRTRIKQAQARIHELTHPHVDKPIPATGPDVSNLQGAVDFAKVKAAGHAFVYVKSSEGGGGGGKPYNDPSFLDNVRAAKAAGLKVGAYHFLRPKPGRTGSQEAAYFIANLKAAGLGKGDLRPVADIEATKLDGPGTQKYLQAFLLALQARTGVKPVVYTYPSFPQGWAPFFADFPLWLADYSGLPDIPYPWVQFVLHQHTSKATVPGIVGHVDLNRTLDLRKVIA